MEVPAPAGILRTAACSSLTLSENPASCLTSSSTEKTVSRSPGRRTWRIKWAAASCSKLISSLSAHKEISFEQEAAAHFIRQVLRPGDRLSVFSVDEDVRQLAGLSVNVNELQAAVRRMPAGAGTSIYDAVLLGSRALAHRGDDRRRVIILVTDAGETTSTSDFDSARKEAVRCNTLLYTIVIRPVKNENAPNTAPEPPLETITDTTGGPMFYPDTPQALGAMIDRIDRELL